VIDRQQPIRIDSETGAYILMVSNGRTGETYRVLLDPEDWERTIQHSWSASITNQQIYFTAYRKPSGGESRTMSLHRFITGAKPGQIVDHIDPTKPLDHRRANLRFATSRQNSQNQQIHRVPKTSRFKGVSLNSATGLWVAQIRVDGKLIKLGTSKSERLAAALYDVNAMYYFGEFARLNFAEEDLPFPSLRDWEGFESIEEDAA